MSDVRHFGASGDGETDDTEAIRHALQDGDGLLRFSPGSYRISRTIEIDLAKRGPLAIDGSGGTARIFMTGPGPVFRIVGTHDGTGDPHSVVGNVYPDQRLPIIKNIEIEGGHPQADGLQLVKTMQCLLEGVLIRRCRHGLHLTQRNRNVLISHCHIYHNTGIGVFLDGVNLHQINIVSSHISYNRLGGIRVERSEVRNLQITGNDIEYNNHAKHGTAPEPTAEIYVDTTAEGASVNEVTIASNTIQATESPGGANIRVVANPNDSNRPPGLWAITGNVIGSQENNVHLTGCYGMSISGNTIYSCGNRNLLMEDSRQINVGANTFRRHTPEMGTGVQVVRSSDVTFSGCSVLDEHPHGQDSGASLLELIDCDRINVSGSQFLDGVPCGIDATDCRNVVVTGCAVHDTRVEGKSRHAIRFRGAGTGNLIASNSIGITKGKPIEVEDKTGVKIAVNTE